MDIDCLDLDGFDDAERTFVAAARRSAVLREARRACQPRLVTNGVFHMQGLAYTSNRCAGCCARRSRPQRAQHDIFRTAPLPSDRTRTSSIRKLLLMSHL